ncbi:MAG TPA: hypothetical protein VFZ78_00940 [Flavisolibacter sp.]
MRKVFTGRLFIVGFSLLTIIAILSFAFYPGAGVSGADRDCCQAPEPSDRNHILWDVLSGQFASSVDFR